MHTYIQTESSNGSRTGALSDIDATTRLVAGLAALVLGAFFVFGVGFAHSAALHDTAHDIRHSYGFPCH